MTNATVVADNALIAYELFRFLTMVEIGELLGISKRRAHLAKQLGEAMCEAGVTDPYIRLSTPPENANRWRTHIKFLTAPEQREAG